MIQYFFFVLCNICLFIVCRASFSLLFPLISNTYTRKNRIYIFSLLLLPFLLAYAFQQCMSLIAKFFLLPFCSSFFFDFIFHVESERTHKNVFGAHITHNNGEKGALGTIFICHFPAKIKNSIFSGFARKFSHPTTFIITRNLSSG